MKDLIVPFLVAASLLFFLCLGANIQKDLMRRQAIKHGAAIYYLNSQTGKITFLWL